MVPEKFLFQRDHTHDDDDSDHDDGKARKKEYDCSGFHDGQLFSWSRILTPLEEKSRARLLQQRHPPTLDLAQLPDDIVWRISGFLNASSLLQMRCLNRKYKSLCARNEAGWKNLCEKLWSTKVHVAECSLLAFQKNAVDGTAMMKAFKKSIQDAQRRHWLTQKELCYDPETQSGTIWSFRFKESAGSDWTLMDPWYNGLPCRKMVFLPDGSIKQYVPGNSALALSRFGATQHAAQEAAEVAAAGFNHEMPREGARQPPMDQWRHRLGNDNDDNNNNNNLRRAAVDGEDHLVVDPPMTMTWRLITRPMDFPSRHVGSYVRITVGGRDVPTYVCRRSPSGNWGFVMESCWGLFASFELPNRLPPSPEGATPPRSPLGSRMEGNRRIENFESSGPLRFMGPGDDDEYSHPAYQSSDSDRGLSSQNDGAQGEHDSLYQLRDDTYMQVTNEAQWREAFLYNIGARVLPEGDFATNEFDRAWSGI